MSGILVTGATGTTGSATLAALIERERAADRDPERSGSDPRPLHAGVRDPESARDRLFDPLPNAKRDTDEVDLVAFDFERPETWGSAFEGVDRLFLVRPPSVSVDRVTDAAAAAARVGVERIVYLSVLGAERNPLLPHHRIEDAVRDLDVEYVFLRASFFMQNLAEVHGAEIRDRSEIFVPAGGGRTSFVDARDLGVVAARALTEPGHANRAYDLTGSEALDYDEVAAVFSSILDRRIEYANPSIPRFLWRRYREDGDLAFAVVMVGVYATARLGLADRVTDDVARILGREPIDVETFAADYRDRWTRAEN
jgi:uncharacterized protein YbjT (DUF2867 family)